MNDQPEQTDYVELRNLRYTFAEIYSVVDAFYREVAKDPILSVPFGSVSDWPHHIERLTHFWWTRFGGRAYQEGFYNPVEKHYEAGFNEGFLQHWLSLFKKTVTQVLPEEKASLWVSVTESMGMALSKNNDLMIQHRGPYTGKSSKA